MNTDVSLNVFTDDSNTTCNVLPRGGFQYAELIWTYRSHGSSVDLFRVVLSGTQSCHSINMSWFVRGERATSNSNISECEVKQSGLGNLQVCSLTCRCVKPGICGYLHYRVQFVPWVTNSTLAMCHFVSFIAPESVKGCEYLLFRLLWQKSLILLWWTASRNNW